MHTGAMHRCLTRNLARRSRATTWVEEQLTGTGAPTVAFLQEVPTGPLAVPGYRTFLGPVAPDLAAGRVPCRSAVLVRQDVAATALIGGPLAALGTYVAAVEVQTPAGTVLLASVHTSPSRVTPGEAARLQTSFGIDVGVRSCETGRGGPTSARRPWRPCPTELSSPLATTTRPSRGTPHTRGTAVVRSSSTGSTGAASPTPPAKAGVVSERPVAALTISWIVSWSLPQRLRECMSTTPTSPSTTSATTLRSGSTSTSDVWFVPSIDTALSAAIPDPRDADQPSDSSSRQRSASVMAIPLIARESLADGDSSQMRSRVQASSRDRDGTV